MLNFIIIITIIIINNGSNMPLAIITTIVCYTTSLQSQPNANTSYLFSSDLISFWITVLTLTVIYILMFSTHSNSPLYKTPLTIITLILVITFNNWNFIIFYILFEVSIIIILIIIISWGYQPERIEAIIFIIIITLIFSLPFFGAIIINNNTLNFWFIEINSHLLTFLSFMFIFIINIPIYFTHFWLPKVHVEAPVHGSMILAAILLNLGCYGIMRINNIILNFNQTNPILLSASLVSIVILSINCIIQIDLNTLIAYSSIVHITIVFTNIILINTNSIFSSICIILGHGLCAACLFYIADLLYNNSNSRSILLNNGLLNLLPAINLIWFASCINNAPMPPSINILGELICFKNLLAWSNTIFTAIATAALVSSMYSIYLFCIPVHGNFSNITNALNLNTSQNSLTVTSIILPIIIITVKPAILTI